VESNRMSQVSRLISIVVLGLLGLAVQATAETYPERVVRIVNPYPPGGSVDVMARILAQKLADNLGQQVIVENRSGGGGNTGSDFVAKAEPDGYTLLFTAPGPLTSTRPSIASFPSIRPRTLLPSRCLRRRRSC
jgi:tripartite-type tricarboxylate transporter receptor subunit TctC